MGKFDDLIRNVVKEELAKGNQGAPEPKPDAAGDAGAAQPEAATTVTGSVNKATETGTPEPSAATENPADTITIKSSDLKDILVQAVREGNAAALNASAAGATPAAADPMKSMARLCGLVKDEKE